MAKKINKRLFDTFDTFDTLLNIDELRIRANHEIPEKLILDTGTDSGFFLGLEYKNDIGWYVGKPSEADGNILVVGTNGSGKSSVCVKSTLETWLDPFIALDIKGELSQQYSQLYHHKYVTRQYVIFDPIQQIGHYDPYDLLDKEDPHLVQYVREISHAIIPRPGDIREPYWIDMARNVLSAAILYYFSNGLDFIETMCMVNDLSTKELCKEIKEHGSPEAKCLVKEITGLKSEQQAAIGTDVQEWTLIFATDPYIRQVLSSEEDSKKDAFSWNKITTDPQAPNVFLRLDQDRLEQWSGVLRLMLTQLIRQLERRPDKHSGEKEMSPILLLLDEFPIIGKMDVITTALTTLRSKKVTVALMLQSLAQLDEVYGQNIRRILVDNCQYKVILNVTEPDSQKYFSQLIGEVSSLNHSVSRGCSHDTEQETLTWQVQQCRKPLIYPETFATNPDICLHTPLGFCRTVKQPLRLFQNNNFRR